MPFTVSLVAATKVWSYVYTDVLMPLTGMPSPLGISSQVIYGLAAIAIWRDMGYCMLIYIAALQSIPGEYYEAARVEGANFWHEFRSITLPMIVPAITANVTLVLSWGLRCFDYSQMVLNMKAAKTTAVFVYEYIFGNSRAGLGQAGAIILTLVLVVLSNSRLFISVSSIPSKAIPTSASTAWRGLRSLRWITIPALFRKTSMWQSALKTAS